MFFDTQGKNNSYLKMFIITKAQKLIKSKLRKMH